MIDPVLLLQAIIQGILEWLPVSSSGFVSLISLILANKPLSNAIDIALAMHLGSGLAALLLMRTDVKDHILYLVRRGSKEKTYLNPYVYVIGLGISLVIAFLIYKVFILRVKDLPLAFIVIGLSLIITSIVTYKRGAPSGTGRISDLDLLILFILQGLAVIPGISRSGVVLAYLGFRRVKPEIAFRTSLLIGIPALLIAGFYGLLGIAKEVNVFSLLVIEAVVFVVSLFTAYYLLNYLRRIRTWLFTLLIGLLLLVSSIIEIVH